MKALLTSRFEEALTFAALRHLTQARKGTTIPYIAHLLAVASLVITHAGDEDEAIAALLHDAVEDQGGLPTREQIRARFGERVAAIVDGCTDTDVIPKPPWRNRKEKYLDHLRAASSSIKLVAAADKLDNVRAIISDFRTIGPTI
jgi:(p)ppGpp synthase/HD superfamily hydrolase